MKPETFIKKLQNGEELTIAALGDSLTYGWMVQKGYICRLREMLCEKYPESKINIINGGSPGDTARGGLYRVWQDVVRHNPDLVIVQFALNDVYTGFSADEFKQNLCSIIDELQAKTNAEIILVTSVPLSNPSENKIVNAYYDRIIECGEKYSLPVVKIHDYWIKKINEGKSFASLIQADGIHPNEQGHVIMAEAVMELF